MARFHITHRVRGLAVGLILGMAPAPAAGAAESG